MGGDSKIEVLVHGLPGCLGGFGRLFHADLIASHLLERTFLGRHVH